MSETVPDPNDLNWHIRLRRILVEYFDEDELETLCFDLRVDFEDLEGENKTQKTISLITHMARLEQVDQLIQQCSELRPNVPWSELRTAAQRHPLIVDENLDGPELWQTTALKRPSTTPTAYLKAQAARLPFSPLVLLSAVVMLVVIGVLIVVLVTRPDTPSPVTGAGRMATAVAPGTTLLAEDFESGPAQDWHAISSRLNPAVVRLPDGNHALQLREGVEALYSPAWNWGVNDYRVEAAVMVADATPDTSMGWNVRILSDNAVGFCQGYRAEIGPDYSALHLSTALRNNCNEPWYYDNLNEGEFLFKEGEWYRLRLDVVGNTLRFYVDGQLALTATDPANTYTRGGIGLIVFASEQAYADNIRVSALTTPASEN
jgi:hypothetical protein